MRSRAIAKKVSAAQFLLSSSTMNLWSIGCVLIVGIGFIAGGCSDGGGHSDVTPQTDALSGDGGLGEQTASGGNAGATGDDGWEVISHNGLDCPLELPAAGTVCEGSGRCDYVSALHWSDTCASTATHRMHCAAGTWSDWGIISATCSCTVENSEQCPEELPFGACSAQGVVCDYSLSLDCEPGCSGGSFYRRACIDGEWRDILHSAGAPGCYCPGQ
jgi:hypothetical protein